MDTRRSLRVLRLTGNERGKEPTATGRRRIGEVGGGDIRLVRQRAHTKWFRFTVQHLGWDGLFVSLPLIAAFVAAFLSTLSVSPKLSSFSSLLFLLSCLRAVVISVRSSRSPFDFFHCFVISIPCFIILSLLHRAYGFFHLFRLHPLPDPVLSYLPHSVLDRRATAYCTYVFSEV